MSTLTPSCGRAAGRVVWALSLGSVLSTAACASSGDNSPSGPSATMVDGSMVSAEEMKRGEFYFFRYCAGCHGPKGAGDGSRGRFSSVPPADLRAGNFRTARAGEGSPPGDAFFRRVILQGIEGTVMKGLPVTEDEITPLIKYVKSLDPSRRN